MKLQEMAQKQENMILNQRKALVERWNPYVNAVDKYFTEKKGRNLSLYERSNMAQCLENAFLAGTLGKKSKLFETSYSDNIEFLGIQLPIIAALLPSLALNELGIVQSLERRQGSVFYLDIKHGQAKGAVADGDNLMSAKNGHGTSQSSRRYAMDRVELETVGAAGSTSYSGTLAYFPVQAGSLTITDGVETFTDNGAGSLVSDASGGNTGTINYTTGAYAVVFSSNAAAIVKATYDYNYEKAANGVAEVDIDMTSETVSARDFSLRTKYTLASAIDLEKAHGLNLENELVKYLAGEIRFEIDHYGIDMISEAAEGNGAADAVGAWDASFSDGEPWIWKKLEFMDQIEKGSNNIFAKTLRGKASYVLCGNNVARVIKQMTPLFVPETGIDKVAPTGPHKIGTLNGLPVVQDPFLASNRYVLGYKGDSYLMAGFIYAPYIPLFASPTVITNDLQAQKGFLSSAGFKVINPGLFTYGTITNLS